MPLGFEQSGVMPGLIQDGGAALSATIQRTGQAIQQSLLQQQAFRQARELGSALTQTDPASDKWPQQAAFLTSQFPLAVSSGLAKEIVTPMAKAYAGFQQAKAAETTLNRQVTMLNARDKVAVNRYDREHPPFVQPGTTVGGDGGLMGGAAEPITDVRPGRTSGLAGLGPVGLTAGAAIDASQGAEQPLPPLPGGPEEAAPVVDAANGMRQRYSQIRAQVADDLVREEQARSSRGLAPRTAKEGNAAIERQAKAIFDAENKARGAGEAQSLEDFAVENGYERIGQSSYFSKGGQGRYQIDTNAKGQHTVKTAPMTSDPEFQQTAEQRRQAAEERRRASMGLERAEQKLKLANVDLDKARRTLDKINSGSATLSAYTKGPKNETLPEGAAAHAFRMDDPEGYKAWKKAVDDLAAAEKKAEEADSDYRKSDEQMAKFLEDTAPAREDAPAGGAKLRWDGARLVPQ